MTPDTPPAPEARRAWMSLLAQAPAARLAALWSDCGPAPAHEILRAPEPGAVMVRGRMGGTGAAFNLGEVTVTRCSVRLGTGQVGHAWVQGLDRAKARTAALIDALMQTPAAERVETAVLSPLRAEARARDAARAARAAATKVEFFTLVRGEDA